MFGPKRLIAASLRHYWRTHLAVAAAVAVTTAVLTGALLVGDSMRGSLRALAIERLGRIDRVLLTDHFFRAELAAQLRRGDGQDNDEAMQAQAAILLPVAIDHGDSDRPARANDVQLLGIQPGFWRLEAQNRRANPAAKGRPINNWPIWARRGQGWQGRRSRHIANTSMQPDAASRRRSGAEIGKLFVGWP